MGPHDEQHNDAEKLHHVIIDHADFQRLRRLPRAPSRKHEQAHRQRDYGKGDREIQFHDSLPSTAPRRAKSARASQERTRLLTGKPGPA